jgi:hypothetical protein
MSTRHTAADVREARRAVKRRAKDNARDAKAVVKARIQQNRKDLI